MIPATAWLEDDEEVRVTGTVVWATPYSSHYDEPPERTHVEDLCVELDGEDVTDALTKHERNVCEDALLDAAREDEQGDPDREWDARMDFTREDYYR
jgi:hypothetical protein